MFYLAMVAELALAVFVIKARATRAGIAVMAFFVAAPVSTMFTGDYCGCFGGKIAADKSLRVFVAGIGGALGAAVRIR